MKTVLIIDTDLGFVFWLGTVLHEGGYRVVPARDVPGAIALVDQFRLEVDVLVVNPALQGSAHFIEHLRRLRAKVIVLIAEAVPAMPMHVDASKQRPSRVDEKTRLEWLELLERLLDCATSNGASGS